MQVVTLASAAARLHFSIETIERVCQGDGGFSRHAGLPHTLDTGRRLCRRIPDGPALRELSKFVAHDKIIAVSQMHGKPNSKAIDHEYVTPKCPSEGGWWRATIISETSRAEHYVDPWCRRRFHSNARSPLGRALITDI
jgi:hypothetical protein